MARLRHRSSLFPELVCLPGEAKVPRLKRVSEPGSPSRIESENERAPAPVAVNAALYRIIRRPARRKKRGECVLFSEKLKREETRGSRAIKSDDTIIVLLPSFFPSFLLRQGFLRIQIISIHWRKWKVSKHKVELDLKMELEMKTTDSKSWFERKKSAK